MPRVLLASLATVVALIGCAGSAPAYFYTLTPPTPASPAPQVQAASVLVHAGPVRMPDALNRPDVQVLSGSSQIVRMPADLWRSNLADEVRAAVLDSLLQDGRVAQSPAPGAGLGGAARLYALHLAVDRMDMALGQYARLDVTWSVQPQPGWAATEATPPAPVICRASWQQPVSGGSVADAVAALQRMVQDWGLRIQRQLLALAGQQRAGACGAAV